ncbi:hypothetical protein DERF_014133 [Dermatophagoides farinae]|nr:hypothetical protein DERF_014133 [Dermatophagoides farinae]
MLVRPKKRREYRNPNIHLIMINNHNDGKQFLIHNDYHSINDDDDHESQGHQYQMIMDTIFFDGNPLGFLCIKSNDMNDNSGMINLQQNPCKTWRQTGPLLRTIDQSITYSGQLYLISKQKQQVLFFDQELLKNISKEFPLSIKSLSDFIICKFRPNSNKQPDETMNATTILTEIETETETTTNKWRISTIIMIVFVFIVLCLWIVYHMMIVRRRRRRNKKRTNSKIAENSKKSISITDKNSENIMNKAIANKIIVQLTPMMKKYFTTTTSITTRSDSSSSNTTTLNKTSPIIKKR